MHILLTGGTGLIGSALCRYWHQQGHQLTVLSRTPAKVAAHCGPTIRGIAQLSELADEHLDAVINLAGAPIAERPWTKKRRALLWESRVNSTERLVDWLANCAQKPTVLISGSAVGIYGDSGDQALPETAPQGDDFASRLCAGWEAAALQAQTLGIRVVLIRTGLVLAPNGGFLRKMLPAYRLGLGGPLGDGQQWMPWIHLDDEVKAIDYLLTQPSAKGPYNLCAPQPVRNAQFSQTLTHALYRPNICRIPAGLLRLALGELSVLLLGSQQAQPAHLHGAGFTFRYPEFAAALHDVLTAYHHKD